MLVIKVMPTIAATRPLVIMATRWRSDGGAEAGKFGNHMTIPIIAIRPSAVMNERVACQSRCSAIPEKVLQRIGQIAMSEN